MKAPTLHGFLEECRAANTSDEIGGAVEQIEQKIGTMRAERAGIEGQLQEAIVAGRDPGSTATAIAQLDQDLITLEAARAGGFSQKQEDARRLEDANAKNALLSKHGHKISGVGGRRERVRGGHGESPRSRCQSGGACKAAGAHGRSAGGPGAAPSREGVRHHPHRNR